MNPPKNQNLSDEAFCNSLAQSSEVITLEAAEGLVSLSAEVIALKHALRSYRMETLEWAERRSATQPSLAAKAKSNRWIAVPQWSLAAVAMVAVAAGVVHFAGYGVEDNLPAAGTSVAVSAAKVSQTDDIAADNQLLGSIHQALHYETVSPYAEYNAKVAEQSDRSTRTGVTD